MLKYFRFMKIYLCASFLATTTITGCHVVNQSGLQAHKRQDISNTNARFSFLSRLSRDEYIATVFYALTNENINNVLAQGSGSNLQTLANEMIQNKDILPDDNFHNYFPNESSNILFEGKMFEKYLEFAKRVASAHQKITKSSKVNREQVAIRMFRDQQSRTKLPTDMSSDEAFLLWVMVSPHSVLRKVDLPNSVDSGDVVVLSGDEVMERLFYFLFGTPPQWNLDIRQELEKFGIDASQLPSFGNSSAITIAELSQHLDKYMRDSISSPQDSENNISQIKKLIGNIVDALLAHSYRRQAFVENLLVKQFGLDLLNRRMDEYTDEGADKSRFHKARKDFVRYVEKYLRANASKRSAGDLESMYTISDIYKGTNDDRGAPNPDGRGLLEQTMILMATSDDQRVNIVSRGKFILERALCFETGSPPQAINFGEGHEDEPAGHRSAAEKHLHILKLQTQTGADKSGCFGCHVKLNQLGFLLNHYTTEGEIDQQMRQFAFADFKVTPNYYNEAYKKYGEAVIEDDQWRKLLHWQRQSGTDLDIKAFTEVTQTAFERCLVRNMTRFALKKNFTDLKQNYGEEFEDFINDEVIGNETMEAIVKKIASSKFFWTEKITGAGATEEESTESSPAKTPSATPVADATDKDPSKCLNLVKQVQNSCAGSCHQSTGIGIEFYNIRNLAHISGNNFVTNGGTKIPTDNATMQAILTIQDLPSDACD